jgi:flagellar basal body-associated protein FliL
LDSGFEFSLDDFDVAGSDDNFDSLGQPPLTIPDEPPEAASPDEQPARAKTISKPVLKKIAILAVSCILLAALGTVAFKYWRGAAGAKKVAIVTMVKRPIVVPNFKESLEFLVMAASQSEKGLLLMNLELEFKDPGRHKQFQGDVVLLRDLTFNFLTSQHPRRNTLGDWRKSVENELNGYLKSALPQCRPDVVRLSQLSKL